VIQITQKQRMPSHKMSTYFENHATVCDTVGNNRLNCLPAGNFEASDGNQIARSRVSRQRRHFCKTDLKDNTMSFFTSSKASDQVKACAAVVSPGPADSTFMLTASSDTAFDRFISTLTQPLFA
jgi:hypothetical protein